MKKAERSKYIILGLLILYIFGMMAGFLIFIPKSLQVFEQNNMDKVIHFAEFLVLTILVLLTFKLFRFRHHYIIGISLAVFFIILSESLQALIPYRDFSYYDMLADLAGIIIGCGVFHWMFSRR